MSDKKADFDLASLLPWAIVLALGYHLWTTPEATPGPTPEPKPVVVTLEKATAGVFPLIRAEHSRIFSKAADMVRRKEIQDETELHTYINAATKAAREAANKPFGVAFESSLPRGEDGSFTNIEEQAAKVLERVAKSW